MQQRIRTILIDDSPFMRKVIGDILSSDSEIDLVGTAADGMEGSAMALDLKPDVVVTDMVMPAYDGMYVVKSLMDKLPLPIILLSSLDKTNSRIFDALNSGAFEFVDKPTELDTHTIKDYPLIKMVKEASRTDIALLHRRQEKKNTELHTFGEKLHYEIVVIGSSTGGPGALELIIQNLPRNLSVPVVIAQHMPARFLETFAHRLNETSPLTIKLAEKAESLRGGTVYIAPGDANTRVERNAITGQPMITFTQKRYEEFNHPSINCLFESVAATYAQRSIGVILTGMGRDGADGLEKIKNAGGFTIAQDEESSIVYGMPKAAVETGAVNQVVPLKEMAGFIISCL